MPITLRRPIPAIRLHRRPAVDAALLVVALAVALGVLWASVQRTRHIVVVADSSRFDAAAALADTRILADSFPNRVTGSLRAQAAAGWLAARFEQIGLRVETQHFEMWLRGSKVRGENVVARSSGREPGAIVLVAHYDGPTTSGPSAAASASGVGTLLELARILESRPHRRPFIYVALDAGTWGQAGAAELARKLSADSVAAAISLDRVGNGRAAGIWIAGIGQGWGFAPMWLRLAAEDVLRYEGTPVREMGVAEEWYLRTIRLSVTDQGPLVAAEIPAINLGTVPADPTYERFLYHTPGDRAETLDADAFRMLGSAAERLVLSLDRNARLEGSFTYLRVGGSRSIRGPVVLLASILLLLPLLLATWEAVGTARLEPAARAAIPTEAVRAAGWWITALLGLLALRALVLTGVLPRFELYPATERDPLLFSTGWVEILLWVAVMVLSAVTLTRVRRKLHLVASHPLTGRAAALITLVVLAVIAVIRNPFAAVWLLALPAWLWPWIGPTRRSLTGAGGALLVPVSVVPALVIAFLVGQRYQVGIRTGWYLFLQAAYGAWSALTVVMIVVIVLAAWRLVGTATARLLPDSGD